MTILGIVNPLLTAGLDRPDQPTVLHLVLSGGDDLDVASYITEGEPRLQHLAEVAAPE
jgi:hypothetical protein